MIIMWEDDDCWGLQKAKLKDGFTVMQNILHNFL